MRPRSSPFGAPAAGRKTRAAPAVGDVRLFGAVAGASLVAVAFCYAVIPFTSDVQAAVQPFPGDWAACYTELRAGGRGPNDDPPLSLPRALRPCGGRRSAAAVEGDGAPC